MSRKDLRQPQSAQMQSSARVAFGKERWTMGLEIVPLTLKEANKAVSMWHRHHKPAVGQKFSIGAVNSQGDLVGVAITGRPIARCTDQRMVLEILRVATDGTRNACSILLGAVGRAAKAMGYARVQTTTLQRESGSSLRAVGWKPSNIDKDGSQWNSRPGRKVDCMNELKVRWQCDYKEGREEIRFPKQLTSEEQPVLFGDE